MSINPVSNDTSTFIQSRADLTNSKVISQNVINTPPDRLGASVEEWQYLIDAGRVAHLLPIVAAGVAKRYGIALGGVFAGSTGELGKIPSIIINSGSGSSNKLEIVGKKGWQNGGVSIGDVKHYQREGDYNIGILCNEIRAFDIDIDDADIVEAVMNILRGHLGDDVVVRTRSNSTHALVPFILKTEGKIPKSKISREEGKGFVEILANGSQFAAHGTHPSGVRYAWSRAGWVNHLREIDVDKFKDICADIQALLGGAVSGFLAGCVYKERNTNIVNDVDIDFDDPLFSKIAEMGLIIGEPAKSGVYNIVCPWEFEHSTQSGHTSTQYVMRGACGSDLPIIACRHESHSEAIKDSRAVAHSLGIGEEYGAWVNRIMSVGLSIIEDEAGNGAAPCANTPKNVLNEIVKAAPVNGVVAPRFRATRGWRADIEYQYTGGDAPRLKNNLHNATVFLRDDGARDGIVKHVGFPCFNEFTQTLTDHQGLLWRDVKYVELMLMAERRSNISFPKETIVNACEQFAHCYGVYNPVKDYLESIEWDGAPRVERLFIDSFGAEDSQYLREVAKCWMVAAVRRIYEPGYKFDYVPVLCGAEGLLKSTFAKILGKSVWFTELGTYDDKISVEVTNGKWIVELPELGATKRSEIEHEKAFLSRTSTKTRPAYARQAVEFKRQFVMIATTNETEYLRSTTGNRRWWPVQCNRGIKDLAAFVGLVDQLWAEAYQMHLAGVPTELSAGVQLVQKAETEKREETDVWSGMVAVWLDTNGVNTTCVMQIANDALNIETSDINSLTRKRISNILNKLPGWVNAGRSKWINKKCGSQKSWQRIEPIIIDTTITDAPCEKF